MKILPNVCTKIPKGRKVYIKKCMESFDKNFSNPSYALWPVYRNKIGIPLHFAAVVKGFADLIADMSSMAGFEKIASDSLWTKVNFDFITYINSINKRKAAAFAQYMKGRGITEDRELLYGTRKYLINAGSYHYPVIFPSKTKQIALSGECKRPIETGVFFARTDGKDLYHRLIHMFTGQRIP